MSDEIQSMFKKPERQKHNYTSEIELKSLLIRLQNWNSVKDEGYKKNLSDKDNRILNRMIKTYTKLNNSDDAINKVKVNNLKKKMKDKIISLSEETKIDTNSYEDFGNIILLMIKNILKKPSFSGYTYREDFYSDAIGKILKYMKNFNHKLISARTGTEVNAFSYISQIIFNSVIFIIKQKQKEQDNLKDVISLEIIYGDLDLKQVHKKSDSVTHSQIEDVTELKIKVDSLEHITLLDIINNINKEIHENDITGVRFIIEYPKNYQISFEEYNGLKDSLKGINVVKSK